MAERKSKYRRLAGPSSSRKGPRRLDRLLHGCKLHHSFAVALFYLAVVLEKGNIFGRGFDPEDLAKLVVHFDRRHVHGMANACTFDSDVIAVADLILVVVVEPLAQGCRRV